MKIRCHKKRLLWESAPHENQLPRKSAVMNICNEIRCNENPFLQKFIATKIHCHEKALLRESAAMRIRASKNSLAPKSAKVTTPMGQTMYFAMDWPHLAKSIGWRQVCKVIPGQQTTQNRTFAGRPAVLSRRHATWPLGCLRPFGAGATRTFHRLRIQGSPYRRPAAIATSRTQTLRLSLTRIAKPSNRRIVCHLPAIWTIRYKSL